MVDDPNAEKIDRLQHRVTGRGLPVGVPDEPPAPAPDDYTLGWNHGYDQALKDEGVAQAAVGVPETTEPDRLARQFHEAYERLAPTFGYETRPESAVAWEDVPQANRDLMRAVVAEVLAARTQVGWWSPTEHALRPLGTFHPNEALMYLYVPVWVEAVPGTSEGEKT